MRSDQAWLHPSEKILKTLPPIKKNVENEIVPVSLDAKAVADAITSHLIGPLNQNLSHTRKQNDEKLILVLSIGITVLAITSLLCALISIIVVASSSRTISKLENLLR